MRLCVGLKKGRRGCRGSGFAMRAMAALLHVNISRKAAKPAKVYAKGIVPTPGRIGDYAFVETEGEEGGCGYRFPAMSGLPSHELVS